MWSRVPFVNLSRCWVKVEVTETLKTMFKMRRTKGDESLFLDQLINKLMKIRFSKKEKTV